jgi:fumarate hydratase class II
LELPAGGTAVGTGINTHPEFGSRVAEVLAKETGIPFVEAKNHFEAQANRDALVEASGALRTIAVGLTKICNDLRWMGSGPNTGLGEIAIPDLQPGSSIMPGKVNPVIPEAVLWKDAVKSGRTHLMDATPVTLGQEFAGYARQVRLGVERVQSTIVRVAEVPLGGTAVGTGINTPKGFPQKVNAELATASGLPITEDKHHFEAQGARDGLVEASGALRVIAVSLTKICNDLRWMGSGPNTGLNEIHIPDLQPGSSIMPGKVNPVIPEAVLMVAARVVGNDATIAWAGASGSFELNVAIPVMGTALLESIRLLANGSRVLADKTVEGLEANVERAAALAGMSPSIVTPLNKFIGYENAAKIAKYAVAEGITVREATIALGFVERGELTVEQLDGALDVLSMTQPG